MLKGLISWFRKQVLSLLPQGAFDEREAIAPKRPVSNNKSYKIDPTFPNLIVDSPIPTSTAWPMSAVGEKGGGYPLQTAPQQAAALRQIVNDTLVYLLGRRAKKPSRWAAASILSLQARAGQDANAFYDRRSLKFFYFPDHGMRRNVFLCDSRHVVAHEFGHAYLDAMRPDFWSLQAPEAWAFHESFADICCLVSVTLNRDVVERAVSDTGGNLALSNPVTRIAMEVGASLRKVASGYTEENGSMRDMSMRFDYVAPEKLPADGPTSQLINEPHSFGRVFSGAFYRLVVEASKDIAKSGVGQVDSFLRARDAMMDRLLISVSQAPRTPRLLHAVCQEMLVADSSLGGTHQNTMRSVFTDYKLIPPVIKMLESKSYDQMLSDLGEAAMIDTAGDFRILRKSGAGRGKVADTVTALSANPLYQAEVELADESCYYFDGDGVMSLAIETTAQEAIDAAMSCLDQIEVRGLASGDDKALFAVDDGKLVRLMIEACGCNKPNYCIPGAPEYQKPWKPKNNAGCVKCGSGTNCLPRPCDCASPTPTPPPKTGCYTRLNVGQSKGVRVCNRASRRVC